MCPYAIVFAKTGACVARSRGIVYPGEDDATLVGACQDINRCLLGNVSEEIMNLSLSLRVFMLAASKIKTGFMQ
jgi:hypothetical protein